MPIATIDANDKAFTHFQNQRLHEYTKRLKKVRILCLGFLYIKEYLENWLIEKKDIKVHIDILYDPKIYDRLGKSNYFKIDVKTVTEWLNSLSDKEISFTFRKFNIDTDEIPASDYHIIFNLYLLHNAVNWRLLVTRLLSKLKDRGIFIFSEVGGNYSILDGNFKNADVSIPEEIYMFDESRNDLFHFWRPELSLSNYKELKNQLEFFFEETIDNEYPSLPDIATSEAWQLGKIAGISISKGYSFKRLMLDKFFSYFNIPEIITEDPSDDSIKQQSRRKQKWDRDVSRVLKNSFANKDLNDKSVFSRSDQLYFCKTFRKADFIRARERHWNYSALIKDIGHIPDNKIEVLGRKAMDIFTSHDVFFPRFTRVISLFSWDHIRQHEVAYPIHFITGKQKKKSEVLLSLSRWILLENITNFKPVRSRFAKALNKFPITISAVSVNHFPKYMAEGYITLEPGRFLYKIERTRKRNVEGIEIVISEGVIGEIFGANKELVNSGKETDIDMTGVFSSMEVEYGILREDIAIRGLISQNEKAERKPDFRYEREVTLNLFKLVNSDLYHKDIKPLFEEINDDDTGSKTTDRGKNEKKQSSLEWIITIAVLFCLHKKDHRISYIPSLIIKDDEYDSTHQTSGTKGIGGALLYEKIPPFDNPILEGIFAARDKALAEAVNLVFYKASIAGYINRNFYAKAMQSAVAAITARSGSHTLGSHVLPMVGTKLAELIYSKGGDFAEDIYSMIREAQQLKELDKTADYLKAPMKKLKQLEENTDFMGNERALLKYVQERLEYVTQIVGELPQWTLSMNFVGDLIKNFYNQYHLLDSLGDTEGLGAYNYIDSDEEHIEFNWLEPENYQLLLDGKHEYISVYSHCVAKDDCISFVRSREEAEKIIKIQGNQPSVEFKVITCPKDQEQKPSGLHKALLEGQAHNFYGQKIKLTGKVKVVGDKIELTKWKRLDRRLVIKVRVRKYLQLTDNLVTDVNNYSNTFSNIKRESFLDIGQKKIDKKIRPLENSPNLPYSTFLGVIKSISFVDGQKPYYKILLFGSWNFFINIQQKELEDLEKSLQLFSKEKRDAKLLFLKPAICVGARVILKGRAERIEEADASRPNMSPKPINQKKIPTYQIKALRGDGMPEFREISFIEYITTTSDIEKEKFRKFHDFPVAIPGGIVGSQAFYIILENIIRNAAKHNWAHMPEFHKAGKNLEVKIELEDHNNQDYFICKVWTNTTNLLFQSAIPDSADLLKDDFLNNPKNLTREINDRLKSPIIDPDGRLRRENLGLSEIKISAAFLAGYNWIESLILSGDEIILTDKEGKTSAGFIRGSMILEEDAGKLVPRLGYRFKLLKPKEIIIVGSRLKDLDKNLQNAGIRLVNDIGSSKNFDYEFCVLYHDKTKDDFVSKLINYINEKNVIPHHRLYELSRQIETFPCRLFIVYSPDEDKLMGNLSGPLAVFFKKRIWFLRKHEFDAHIREASRDPSTIPGFKNYLYKCWTRMFKSPNHDYQLSIMMQGNPTDKIIPDALTVPYNLRNLRHPGAKGEEQLNEKNTGDISESDSIITGANTCVIKYNRHDNEKTIYSEKPWSRDVFCDGFSGTSKIFNVLKDYSPKDKKMTEKLVENGLTTILILDERICEYVQSPKTNKFKGTMLDSNLYHRFQNLNILLPHEVTIAGKTFYKSKLDLAGLGFKEEEISKINFSDKTERDRTINSISFYHTVLSATQEKKSNRISCMVIHQTILDHFCKAIFPNDTGEGEDLSPADRIILHLKHVENIPCIIITSGRGRSAKSSQYAKFMPFSNISDLLLRRDPDKFTLTQILLQSLNLSSDGNTSFGDFTNG